MWNQKKKNPSNTESAKRNKHNPYGAKDLNLAEFRALSSARDENNKMRPKFDKERQPQTRACNMDQRVQKVGIQVASTRYVGDVLYSRQLGRHNYSGIGVRIVISAQLGPAVWSTSRSISPLYWILAISPKRCNAVAWCALQYPTLPTWALHVLYAMSTTARSPPQPCCDHGLHQQQIRTRMLAPLLANPGGVSRLILGNIAPAPSPAAHLSTFVSRCNSALHAHQTAGS